MEYLKKIFTFPERIITAGNSNISILTSYRDFPRNIILPNATPSHVMEIYLNTHMKAGTICRGELDFDNVSKAFSNTSYPTIFKVVVDQRHKRLVGFSIAHLKGKDLYVDILCAMERKKNGTRIKQGFGSILIKELKNEAARFGAEYVTLHYVPSAYPFYVEKMGFSERRGRETLLELKIPSMTAAARRKLLPQGTPATPARTTATGGRIQKALRSVSPKSKKTATVSARKPSNITRIRNALKSISSNKPSVNTGTTKASARIQKALAKSFLPPISSKIKSPSSKSIKKRSPLPNISSKKI